MRTGAHRLVAALLAGGLLTTACGARLSDDQLEQALRTGGSGGAPVPGDVAPVDGAPLPDALDDGGAGPAPGDPAAPAAPDAGAPAGDPAAGGDPGAPAPAGGGGGDAPAGGGGGGGGGAPAPAGTTDTRRAPAGGNGGATDKGVTADEIVISNVSDISGAVPGLFEDAQLAVKAYVAFFTASEGTIYGRRLKFLPLDSRLDTGANRSASIQACGESFAGVGSVSAFDQGGAPVIRDCGLPDLRGLATTDQMKAVPNVYPVNAAGQPGQRSMGVYGWAGKQFPEAVKKAAFLFSDGEVTRQLAEQDIEGAEAAHGYEFIYKAPIAVQETNYSPFVQQLKAKGVRYVTFVGAYQQAANLAKTMQQQGFKPDVYQPTVTAYTPEFLKLGGAAVEGTYVAVAPSLLEEIGRNRELQLYARWLDQVEPGATPTGIGQYAWASAKLFVEKAKEIGPKPTRKALLAAMPKVTAYTGGGLFPEQNIGGKKITDCTSVVQVKGGRFVRHEPKAVGADRCGDGVWDSKRNAIVSRG